MNRRRRSRTAILLYGSSRERTYCDAAAAIVQRFSDIRRFKIIFLDDSWSVPERNRRVNEIWSEAERVGSGGDLYDRVSQTEVSHKVATWSQFLSGLTGNVAVVDVSAVNKVLAVDAVAGALPRSHIVVGYLRWEESITPGKVKRVGSDPHEYVDLTQMEAARKLQRAYRRTSIFVRLLVLSMAVVGGLAIGSIWFPAFRITLQIVVIVSVVVSFISLVFALKKPA